MFKDCKSNKTCVYCGEFNVYHRSLCPKRFPLSTSIARNKVSEENGLHVIKNVNERDGYDANGVDGCNQHRNERITSGALTDGFGVP